MSDNELGGVDDGKALGIVTALEIKRRKIGYSAHRAMVEPPFKADRADRGVTPSASRLRTAKIATCESRSSLELRRAQL